MCYDYVSNKTKWMGSELYSVGSIEGVSRLKQERYNIFFDSKSGLVPGVLDLCRTSDGVSGHITMLGHGTNVTGGHMDGNQRQFEGTIWIKDREVAFTASGELNDEVLELDMTIGSKQVSLTGFPIT